MHNDLSLSPLLIENHLLAILSPIEYQQLLFKLENVFLSFGEVLYEPDDIVDYIYFPTDCVISLLTLVEGHQALEVGIIGREGIIGASVALGAKNAPMRFLVQGGGAALRMPAWSFKKEIEQCASLKQAVYLYTHALMLQIAQTAACNRFHVIEARLARWLLMTRDRVQSHHFYLTHEFLAKMLGVRRVGVTRAASILQQKKFIGYSRGNIEILDDVGLEQVACVCYKIIHNLDNSSLRVAPENENSELHYE